MRVGDDGDSDDANDDDDDDHDDDDHDDDDAVSPPAFVLSEPDQLSLLYPRYVLSGSAIFMTDSGRGCGACTAFSARTCTNARQQR